MSFRSPTAADIGKTVEVRNNDKEEWQKGVLRSFEINDVDDFTFWTGENPHSHWSFWWHCRVPYSCPDPIAELSMAADLLAERGADEASKILALFAAMDNSQRNYILRMIEEKDERLRPFEFRMMMQDYGNVHFDRRSLYRPST